MRTDDLQIPSRFEVRDARPGTGRGLFALQPIRRGEFLLEYTGKKVPTVVADESDSAYLFEINSDWTIDGPPHLNPAGYINHDCHPNTESDIVEGHIIIEAIRDIAAGEELTIDYGDEYFDEFIRPGGCHCASCANGLASPHMRPAHTLS